MQEGGSDPGQEEPWKGRRLDGGLRREQSRAVGAEIFPEFGREGGVWLLILLKPKPSQKGGFPQLSTTFLLTLLPLVGLAELALAICVNR